MRKLIAIDLDGTLLRSDSTISAESEAYLQQAVADGHVLTVVTGRSWASSLRYVRQLGISSPYIVHNGAWITDVSAAILQLSPIAADAARDFWLYCNEKQIACTFTTTRGLYINRDDSHSIENHLAHEGTSPEVKTDRPPEADEPLLAICINSRDSETYLSVYGQLSKRFGQRLNIYRVGYNMINVAAPGVSKGRALEYLASHLSIPMDDVIAFGDNHNDVDMLQKAGTGVAMEGSDPETLAVADIVAPANNQDGVIAVLRQLI